MIVCLLCFIPFLFVLLVCFLFVFCFCFLRLFHVLICD